MNYMKEVAQMLGVELNEEFNIGFYKYIKHRLTKHGLEYFYEQDKKWMLSDCLDDILKGTYEIVKIPILDEAEKRYLSNIIKPWKNCIYCIFKYGSGDYEYIVIKYDNKLIGKDQFILLPAFEKGKMYKGMKFGKEYTLEELGL